MTTTPPADTTARTTRSPRSGTTTRATSTTRRTTPSRTRPAAAAAGPADDAPAAAAAAVPTAAPTPPRKTSTRRAPAARVTAAAPVVVEPPAREPARPVQPPVVPQDAAPVITPAPAFSPEQVSEVLMLLKRADTVELKLSVPDSHHRSTAAALGMDPLQAQLRQVTFFDTPDLALDRAGLVVRARRIQGRAADSVVKLRPVVPDELSPSLRRRPGFGVEVDAMPGGFVCSARMKALVDPAKATKLLRGGGPVRRLFTKEQRAFYADHAPEGVSLDDLVPLGPLNVLKLTFTPDGFSRRLVAELWFYPDGSRILELSTKTVPRKAFQVAAEAKALLLERGVPLSAEQQTKTRTALDFFAHPADPS